MSHLLYRDYTASYRLLGQHWRATVMPDDSGLILAAPEATATQEEGETVLIERIKAVVDADIEHRKAAEANASSKTNPSKADDEKG